MKILFPTDFSYNANAALMFAAEVCKHNGGELILANAVHVPMVDSGAVPVVEEMMDDLRENAEKQLKGLTELLSTEHQIKAETRLEFGFAADVIIDIARQLKVDMIIMGTKGASNVVDRVFGSITSEVMKRSEVPVMIIPQHALFKGFSKVAVSTELKSDDIALAKQVAEFCKASNPELTLVHIESEKDEEEALVTFKQRLSEQMPGANFQRFQSDSIAEGLDDYVDLENMHLLAIKRQKRNFLESLFHKSVTKELAYHSKIPVMVFH
jgi:nucleotide-binding universal stress UspA family protein